MELHCTGMVLVLVACPPKRGALLNDSLFVDCPTALLFAVVHVCRQRRDVADNRKERGSVGKREREREETFFACFGACQKERENA